MAAATFAAVDLGASGGRVVAGTVDGDVVELDVVHRFPNGIAEADGHLRWDLERLFDEVVDGLGLLAARHRGVRSIGIDTWAVDYGLLDERGDLLAQPIAYRDPRTAAAVDAVHAVIPPDELYRRTGLQHLPFTTIYQLAAERTSPHWASAAHIVLLPDLLAFWLTGELATEATNASTTGLVDVTTATWATDLLDRLDLPVDRFPPIAEPGTVRGELRPELCARTGLPAGTQVLTVASHDTASAVVGVPASTDRFAYVASGTWSLVGLELDRPVLTEESRAANFTNERGIDGSIRYLRNVGGLWLLQESVRHWTDEGRTVDLVDLLAAAADLPAGGPTVDVDDDAFLEPGDMPARIGGAAAAAGCAPPATAAATVRCIIDSLAEAHAAAIGQAAELSGQPVDVVHVVGGGARNDLLCQRTAELTGLPVIAGPVEATAVGNVMVQARAAGAAPPTLDGIRAVIAASAEVRTFTPEAG